MSTPNSPSKFRWYIFADFWEVTGTNEGKVARQFADAETYLVIDTYDNTVMMPSRADGGDAVGVDIPEQKAPTP